MSDYAVSIDIDAEARDVWKVMSRVERWPEWTASVTHVRPLRAGPLRVGMRVLIRQPRLPPALWRVTKLVEGRGFTWVSRVPGLRVVAGHWIADDGPRSRVTLSIHYGGLFGGVLGRLTRTLTERYVQLEAAGLKRQAEAMRTSPGQSSEQAHE